MCTDFNSDEGCLKGLFKLWLNNYVVLQFHVCSKIFLAMDLAVQNIWHL